MLSFRKNKVIALVFSTVLLGALCFGQQPPPAAPDGAPQGRGGGPGHHGPGGGPGGPLRIGPPGRWWDDPEFIKKLNLSEDQQKKMDEIFTTNRLKLIDLFATVQKEETMMEPLVAADPPDENKLLAQIDRVAQARAELEKANARMLLGIRRQMNHEQWLKLKAERPPMHGPVRGFRPDREDAGPDGEPSPGRP